MAEGPLVPEGVTSNLFFHLTVAFGASVQVVLQGVTFLPNVLARAGVENDAVGRKHSMSLLALQCMESFWDLFLSHR